MDSNHRPSGYEPDELPLLHAASAAVLVHRPRLPGSHLPSTLGAARFHVPVRHGAGWVPRAPDTPVLPVSVPSAPRAYATIARSLSLPSRVLVFTTPAGCSLTRQALGPQ